MAPEKLYRNTFAAFLATCREVGSRGRAVILQRACNNIFFVSKTRRSRNSGIHVLYQMQDFSIRHAAENLEQSLVSA